ncbi:MAG: hypothetical protein KOO60_13230, partial [Gemmatimonadales bacterium]|nr:hypothetical protein [Gemmatimonadales bacterium]
MKITTHKTMAILALTFLFMAVSFITTEMTLAGDLPVQVERTWAPDGDLIGLDNHWAAGFSSLDQYGSESKNLEDWQLGEQYSGFGLFSYSKMFRKDKHFSIRSYGSNQDGLDLTGRFQLKSGCIGKRTLTFNHRGYNYFSDATSEMRAHSFSSGLPPVAMATDTGLAWCRNDVALRYHVSDRLDLSLGLARTKRSGSKGSLLRIGSDSTAPGLKLFDTDTKELWWGGALAMGKLATDLRMSYRTSEGQRDLDDRHVFTDDQKVFNTRLGAIYEIGNNTRLLGNFTNSSLENDGGEALAANTYTVSSKATTNAGHLGMIKRLGTSSTLRVSARLRSQTINSQTDEGVAPQQFTNRDRTSEDYRATLRHTGIAKTKLEAYYRYKSSDLDAVTTSGITVQAGHVNQLDSQATLAERSRQEAGFKGKYRFGPKASLKARLVWRNEDVNQVETLSTADDQPWFFWMGDRKTDQLRWQLSLQARPRKNLSLDLGHQAIDQTFERTGTIVSETTWQTQRGFAAANWRLNNRLTLHGNASMGLDKLELTDGPDVGGGLGPLTYDGITCRLAPGAFLQVTKKLQLEAHYESVRFEDKGDDPDGLNQLNSDYDRTTVRARWRLMDKTSLAASYR